MEDDQGRELQPGDSFEGTFHVESSQEPELGEDTVLGPGDYNIYVPPGQRAVIRYEIAIEGEDDDSQTATECGIGVTFDPNDLSQG